MSGSFADSNGSDTALQPGLGDSITLGQLKSMVPKPKVSVRLVVPLKGSEERVDC
jgi:hypothetical protein